MISTNISYLTKGSLTYISASEYSGCTAVIDPSHSEVGHTRGGGVYVHYNYMQLFTSIPFP